MFLFFPRLPSSFFTLPKLKPFFFWRCGPPLPLYRLFFPIFSGKATLPHHVSFCCSSWFPGKFLWFSLLLASCWGSFLLFFWESGCSWRRQRRFSRSFPSSQRLTSLTQSSFLNLLRSFPTLVSLSKSKFVGVFPLRSFSTTIPFILPKLIFFSFLMSSFAPETPSCVGGGCPLLGCPGPPQNTPSYQSPVPICLVLKPFFFDIFLFFSFPPLVITLRKLDAGLMFFLTPPLLFFPWARASVFSPCFKPIYSFVPFPPSLPFYLVEGWTEDVCFFCSPSFFPRTCCPSAPQDLCILFSCFFSLAHYLLRLFSGPEEFSLPALSFVHFQVLIPILCPPQVPLKNTRLQDYQFFPPLRSSFRTTVCFLQSPSRVCRLLGVEALLQFFLFQCFSSPFCFLRWMLFPPLWQIGPMTPCFVVIDAALSPCSFLFLYLFSMKRTLLSCPMPDFLWIENQCRSFYDDLLMFTTGTSPSLQVAPWSGVLPFLSAIQPFWIPQLEADFLHAHSHLSQPFIRPFRPKFHFLRGGRNWPPSSCRLIRPFPQLHLEFFQIFLCVPVAA